MGLVTINHDEMLTAFSAYDEAGQMLTAATKMEEFQQGIAFIQAAQAKYLKNRPSEWITIQNGQLWKTYVGCTGKREDHTLGNISLLMRYYREMNINGTMFTDSGYFTPAQGEQTFDSMPGQQVSIFNFGCKTITSEGLKWNSYAYQELWQGTLNESLADHFTMRTDGFYMIFRTYSNN